MVAVFGTVPSNEWGMRENWRGTTHTKNILSLCRPFLGGRSSTNLSTCGPWLLSPPKTAVQSIASAGEKKKVNLRIEKVRNVQSQVMKKNIDFEFMWRRKKKSRVASISVNERIVGG